MTISQILQTSFEKLKNKRIDSALLDAEVLLSYVINKNKEYIITNPDKKLSVEQIEQYHQLISRRESYEPIAYIIGQKNFYNLDLEVNNNVLIPRPETEQMIDAVISYSGDKKLTIVDVGAGSGAISIALATSLPNCKIIATDISDTALEVAQKNALKHKANIKFIKTNLIEDLSDESIDIIVANLPYLPEAEKDLDTVLVKPVKYEPQIALYSGKYGLDAYKQLFRQIRFRSQLPEAIFCEINSTYPLKSKRLADINFPNYHIDLIKDLCDHERFLHITKNRT